MSGAQTSTFSNVLYDPLMASHQTSAENQLLMQQQDIGGHELEMGARLAGTLLSSYDTPEARAAAYPTLLAQARSVAPGYFKNAPVAYPGDQATQALARLGTPSAELFKLQGTAGAVDAYSGSIGLTGTRPGGGGAGSGGTTTSGTDTAPINAAGDSRTRKAGEGGPPAPGSPGAAVAQRVHDFWRSKGFSEEQTAGIMAGGPGSESNFIPTASGDGGTSIGLYQHHATRLHNTQGTGLLDRYGPNPTVDQQNEYAHWEITQGPLKAVGEMLKQAKTPAEAAAIWTQYFGVPADKSEIGRRARGADRFMVYAGQPGAPGASTAPGVITGNVARPGDVPPPPGGALGAYGGGGMGTVIGGQPAAARATIPAGRPTGPPVITDQPAGGGVVAGPPGTAVVGQPVPPSPAVPGNVAAINAGIVGAGGQPAIDPNITPTPARYAGTTPAPSVEAAPEPGWGSQVGSGYGPQNALAPAVPPSPPAAPPAATAQAATPAAATTAQPAAQAMPPEIQTDSNYLTARDKQQLAPLFDQARRGLIPLTTLQNEVQQRQTFNVARQKEFLAAQQQTFENQRQAEADRRAAEQLRLSQQDDQRKAEQLKLSQAESQRQAEAAKRDAERLKIAQAEAAVKAQQAALPFQGTGDWVQQTNMLMTKDPSSKEYAAAYEKLAAPIYHPDGSKEYPILSAFPKPTWKPAGTTETPDYGETKVSAPTILSPQQAQAASFADRLQASLPIITDTSPAAMNRWQQLLGQVPLAGNSLVSSEFQQHMQAERDFINAVLRRESGMAISSSEFTSARAQYIPQPGDGPAVLAQKARNRELQLTGLRRDAGPGYKPPADSTSATTAAVPPPPKGFQVIQ